MQVGCSTLPHANAVRTAPCAVNYVITRPPFPSRGKNERSNVRVRGMQGQSNSPPFFATFVTQIQTLDPSVVVTQRLYNG